MTIDKQKLQKLLWSEVASWKADCGEWKQNAEALGEFLGEKTVGEVAVELLAENERLTANVKLNLCDHPAVHWGDVDLLVASVSGTSQIELAKVHGCTPPNISRKIRRVKGRLGWREGMSVVEIRARAEQLRALASQGAVVTADLMAERDQLKAENEALRSDIQSWRLSIEAERNVHKLSLKGIQDELDRLKGLGFAEELAVLCKSAARYQWLREARSGYIEVVEWIGPHATGMTGEDLDSLLDAAMGMGGRS
ncbi:hypothetical protein [Pseudomonas sp. R5-89-07]|uniref:hypothetical protein n=1 Tax=Pseudomonas sp. R5-89-07 TaxID=658644 RepID=UPI000F6ED94D|nr:hypothetical protein [Pseudomonas sp. R5-89-07]AZF05636.1 hypothetical protein C4J94_2869 [Pseudomonas sp. R5-89-07]